ncbi:unnamed protein product, partial [Phaeothamnion confervicola]
LLLRFARENVAMKVVVTGAAGKTGSLVFKKLLDRDGFDPIGIVRSSSSIKTLTKLGAPKSAIAIADVTQKDGLEEAMRGADAVVLCSSATPKIIFWSLIKLLFNKFILRKANPGRPQFRWRGGGEPEIVDWLGAKNQIDSAKAVGVKQFVFVSSMGGTQPDNFLNSIGKRADGKGGDILLWKRKAEKYLVESGLPYTIIHPGGLLDKPGGRRELTVGVDDELLKLPRRSIPRADVAEVCVQSLGLKEAINRSFDLASQDEGGVPTLLLAPLLAGLNGRNCDYSLGVSV